MSYDAKKRHERYMRNRAAEIAAAKNRHAANADEINAKKRARYHDNIDEQRKKLRERQARRRAKLKMCQNDTNSKKSDKNQCQNDTNVDKIEIKMSQNDTLKDN